MDELYQTIMNSFSVSFSLGLTAVFGILLVLILDFLRYD